MICQQNGAEGKDREEAKMEKSSLRAAGQPSRVAIAFRLKTAAYHRKQAGFRVLQHEILILKLIPVNARAPCAIALRRLFVVQQIKY